MPAKQDPSPEEIAAACLATVGDGMNEVSEKRHDNVTSEILQKSPCCDTIALIHISGGGLVAEIDGITIAVEINHQRRVSIANSKSIAVAQGEPWYSYRPWFCLECRHCGRYVLRKAHSAKYCSKECSAIEAAKSQVVRRAGYQVKRRERLPKKCDVCRATIDAERASKKYCGDKCRQSAWRKWLKPDKQKKGQACQK